MNPDIFLKKFRVNGHILINRFKKWFPKFYVFFNEEFCDCMPSVNMNKAKQSLLKTKTEHDL